MVTPARKGERHGCCRLLKKNPGEGQLTEEFCIKSNNKFGVSLQEFIQVKIAQYSTTTARTVTFLMSVLKTKSGSLCKILHIFLMVDWCCFQQVYHS